MHSYPPNALDNSPCGAYTPQDRLPHGTKQGNTMHTITPISRHARELARQHIATLAKIRGVAIPAGTLMTKCANAAILRALARIEEQHKAALDFIKSDPTIAE